MVEGSESSAYGTMAGGGRSELPNLIRLQRDGKEGQAERGGCLHLCLSSHRPNTLCLGESLV